MSLESENEPAAPAVVAAAAPLSTTSRPTTAPAPLDDPLFRPLSRTVSRSSRRTARSVTPPVPKGKSRSPPPGSGHASKRSSRDVSTDEHISILDPRRFTPTLHASLVSEILTLRRDQEEKLKIIESLETSLHTVREETETLQATLLSTGKETRSLKRQLSLLEGGTSSAFTELTKERDEAVESANEAKRRLEAAQKKLKSQEEDSERVHEQWAREKDAWEEERRKYERRIHVAETRLKAVLDEVAAFQAAQAANGGLNDVNGPESDGEESVKDDGASVRSMSITNSMRFSVANSILRANGNSLADELGDGYDEDSDYGGRDSVLSKHHSRTWSKDSIVFRTHQRHRSIDSVTRPGSVLRGKLAFNPAALEKLEAGVIREDDEASVSTAAPFRLVYVDTGVQPSPPPSPKLVPVKPPTPEPRPLSQTYERLGGLESPPRSDSEIEANQRRKRVHSAQPLAIRAPPAPSALMVNGSSQTAEEPLSPPKTPRSPQRAPPPPPSPRPEPPVMVSASTQTEEAPPPLQPSSLLPMPIPSISIIPSSRPTTPREPRLPQLCKDFGCQVSLPINVSMTTSSTQTEQILIDKRLAKLPPHLHPSAIRSRPVSPALGTPTVDTFSDENQQFTPIPGNLPPRNPRRLTVKRDSTDLPSPVSPSLSDGAVTRDLYPGNNDDGPLSSGKAPMRRPPRISSLFAGFDGNSSDDDVEFMEPELSDSEYRTALSAPKPMAGSSRAGGKRSSIGTVASSENAFSPMVRGRLLSRGSEDDEAIDSALNSLREAVQGRRGARRGSRAGMYGSKAGVMRRTAMIHNGIASHQRARSPSLTDLKEPPFPIPMRASSKVYPVLSTSAPSDGYSSPSRSPYDSWSRRGSTRSHYRANSIRKVRSTTAFSRNQQRHRRRTSRSPPPSTDGPLDSPGLPGLPHGGGDITVPRTRDSSRARYKGHRSHPSTTTDHTTETGAGSQGGSQQQTPTVVDAIAQTMVGEWMFKYVRRRKSFGVTDTRGGDDSSNDRHKRWVWLAPYERAILWSSKQPVSGSALLGKSGRKLTIQSVLDVKDNNPPPKGVAQIFDRSILILTPQRALKFTAPNAERHYIWLTALSFLAHSNQAIPETLTAPPQPQPLVEQYPIPKPKRKAIRDSIRLTKAKAPALIKSDPVTEELQEPDSAPPSIPSYRPPPIPEVYRFPTHTREISRDTAEPPPIPRFLDRGFDRSSPANHAPVHGRKRSNTGGHIPPPLSFRGFSGPAGSGGAYHTSSNSTAGNSVVTAGSSDIYSNGGNSAITMATGSSAVTWARSSEASSSRGGHYQYGYQHQPSLAPLPNQSGGNFFDAIGTVRMEAFISPLQFTHEAMHGDDRSSIGPPPSLYNFASSRRRSSKELRRRHSRNSRLRDSYHSRGTRTTDDTGEFDWRGGDDPFRGF
ncbi:hypothetical protein VTJ83DRAFT_7241 [Remersonia thermophila]|uniref:Pleckstrin homology domain-containing protein n=1 Tax=Remersonia thermophila TaxID=72144 RepID=A0ABR4D2Z8_9PEZI